MINLLIIISYLIFKQKPSFYINIYFRGFEENIMKKRKLFYFRCNDFVISNKHVFTYILIEMVIVPSLLVLLLLVIQHVCGINCFFTIQLS
jgi:hypothetical protein